MAELNEEEKQQAEAQAQQQTAVPLPEYEKQQYVRGTNPYANVANPYDTFINDYASRIGTPEQIAEQEKKIQRGRTFWQGMNALTNVMANYINTNGVGQGAPNMTFNDNTQKLVDAWSANDDKRYRERKALSDKYDQLRQNQAIFNTNIEQNKAKWEADEDAKERAFNAGEEAKAQQVRMDNAKIYRNEEREKEKQEFQASENAKNRAAANARANAKVNTSSKNGSGGNKKADYNFYVDKDRYIELDSEKMNESVRNNIYGKMYEILEGGKNPLDFNNPKQPKSSKSDERVLYIQDNFVNLYETNREFRQWIDEVYPDLSEQMDAIPYSGVINPYGNPNYNMQYNLISSAARAAMKKSKQKDNGGSWLQTEEENTQSENNNSWLK